MFDYSIVVFPGYPKLALTRPSGNDLGQGLSYIAEHWGELDEFTNCFILS